MDALNVKLNPNECAEAIRHLNRVSSFVQTRKIAYKKMPSPRVEVQQAITNLEAAIATVTNTSAFRIFRMINGHALNLKTILPYKGNSFNVEIPQIVKYANYIMNKYGKSNKT